MIKVILTSDDFGLSIVFNEKIIEQVELHKLTSVSILVNQVSVLQYNQIRQLQNLRKTQSLSLGLHFEVPNSDILEGLNYQWCQFLELFQEPPNYIDIHKGSAYIGSFDEIALFCIEKSIPFRHYSQTKIQVKSPDFSITATRKSIEELRDILNNLISEKIYEFIFHIGVFDPDSKSRFNKERELDNEKLNFVAKNLTYEKVKIISYRDI